MTSGAFMVKGDLAHAGPTVAAQSGRIFDLLTHLRGAVAQLAGTWTGPGAAESYQHLQAQWDAASHSLFGDGTGSPDSILGAIAYDLNRIADNWAQTEQANRSTWAHG